MMRILLTGASGFIGSHVARRLLQKNADGLALVRPKHDGRRIEDIRGRFELMQGSLEDCAALQDQIVRFAPEVCIHLAWQLPGMLDNDESDRRSLAGSLGLLEVLRSPSCSHFVPAGTYTEYCSSAEPVSEDARLCPAT